MKKKKKHGRRSYLDDFIRDASGEYVYNGVLFQYDGSAVCRKKAFSRLWTFGAISALAAVFCGCIPAAGMDNCVYVIMPYVFGILSALSVVWALCRLSAGGDPLKEYVYNASVLKLPVRCVLTAAFSFAALLGEGIYLIINGFNGRILFSVAFLAMETLAGISAIVLRSTILMLRWTVNK